MRILPLYILRQHLVPFLLGLGVVTFILMMDVVFDHLDLLINQGVPALIVATLFGLALGFIVALAVPCAVLIATLMAFGRMSQDNEITAMRASGIHLFSAIVLPLLAAVGMAVGLTLFNNHVYPDMNHAYAGLLIDIGRMRPTVKLQEGVFIEDFAGYNLLVRSVDGQTNALEGVTIYQLNPGGQPTTILAERGFLSYTKDGRTAVLELKNGEIHEVPRDAEGARRYHRLVFKQHTIFIRDAGGMLERTVRRSRGDREKSARTLLDERAEVLTQFQTSLDLKRKRFEQAGVPAAALDALAPERAPLLRRAAMLAGGLLRQPDPLARVLDEHPSVRMEGDLWRLERDALRRRIASLSVEVHKKFALPAACVVFVLIGAPIGMKVRRGGPAIAFASIGFFLFYYLCLVVGEQLATRLLLPAWLAMWLANLVLGLLGLELTARACEFRLPWHGSRQLQPTPRDPILREPQDAAAA